MGSNNLSLTVISTEILKHSRNDKTDKFEYRAYSFEVLSYIACLREYISIQSDQFVIILKKPFKGGPTDATKMCIRGFIYHEYY